MIFLVLIIFLLVTNKSLIFICKASSWHFKKSLQLLCWNFSFMKQKTILGFSYPFTLLTIRLVCVCVWELTFSSSWLPQFFITLLCQHRDARTVHTPNFDRVLGSCGQKKKNHVYKNQGWEPIHKRYAANESTSKHNQEKKQKQTINKS